MQQEFGKVGDPQTLLGDASIDGAVTGADLITVQQEFGNVAPASGLASASAAAVPEPSSIMLLAAGAAGLAGWRRRRSGKTY